MPKQKTSSKPRKKVKKTAALQMVAVLQQLTEALVNLDAKVTKMETRDNITHSPASNPPTSNPPTKVADNSGARVIASVGDSTIKNSNPFSDNLPSTSVVGKPRSERVAKTRFELWSYDEYNQGSIVSSSSDLGQIFIAAKNFVTETNVNNSLASGEKDKAWEAYFPIVFKGGKPDNDILYGGNKRNGKHHVYVRGPEKWELQEAQAVLDLRFYLGELSNARVKTDWFLADHRGRVVSSFDDILLDRKTVLFVKII